MKEKKMNRGIFVINVLSLDTTAAKDYDQVLINFKLFVPIFNTK